MARLVVEGMEAGALGVSTSRTIMHAAITGEPVPGTFAAEDELFGLGEALKQVGRGVFELAPAGALGEDLLAAEREMAWACKLGAHIGRPISFACNQVPTDADEWRRLLDLAEAAVADGADVRPQVHARTVSLLIGLDTFHPLMWCEPWAEVAGLPHDEMVAVLGRPEMKERFLPGLSVLDDPNFAFQSPTRLYQLGDPPNYEPEPSESVANRAARAGRDAGEFLYDLLLEDNGHELLNSPILNYANGSLDPTYEMLTSPITTFGLSDGGAHAGQTCDASATTYLLSHWSRDRSRGPKIPVEAVVAKMTSMTASLYGLGDRGVVAPGYVGDLNVIDYERLQLHRPEVAHDLPGQAKRLIQRADGYIATVKGGRTLMEEGQDTGLRSGALLRGPR
jgi:N-acyl-D-aspartate/D-glutamate deacylase